MQKAQWLMAQLIDWHWRDAKPAAWEFYNLADKNDEQLLDERKALSGLVFERAFENSKGKTIHEYRLSSAPLIRTSANASWARVSSN